MSWGMDIYPLPSPSECASIPNLFLKQERAIGVGGSYVFIYAVPFGSDSDSIWIVLVGKGPGVGKDHLSLPRQEIFETRNVFNVLFLKERNRS